MGCMELNNYLSSVKGLPFFYVVGDAEYKSVLEELMSSGFKVMKLSEFCSSNDKFPNIDCLVDKLREIDMDYRDSKVVVIGLGEFLAIKGGIFSFEVLSRLKNTTIGNAKVVLLLRGISAQAIDLIKEDHRMCEQQRAHISSNCSSNLSFTNVTVRGTDLVSQPGVKYLLNEFEDGKCTDIYASTTLLLADSLIPFNLLSSVYDIIKLKIIGLKITAEMGSEQQWQKLYSELSKCEFDLEAIFRGYNIDSSVFDVLYETVSGQEYSNWLVFLYFKQNVGTFSNDYMSEVIKATSRFEDLKFNLLTLIIKHKHTDTDFMKLYSERKKLLKDFPEEDIAIFVKKNEIDFRESIYHLTDNTLLERKCVIKWIANHGMTDAISYVYPALNAYLKKYTFDCPVIAAELTEYFDKYKHLKVENCVDDAEFNTFVEKYGKEYFYAKLKTRDNAIKDISDKKNSYLYWIDALGVEYLSYIISLAKKKGLSVRVDITRCELPTFTEFNKAFYYEHWAGKKYKEEALDDIKHNEKGGYFFRDEETGIGDVEPLHLAAELKVIETAVSTAAYELGMHNCKSFVIASDHGASRLAVIKKQEVPYDTDTKGEHSGRCCKFFDNCNVENKVVENGYIVLTDYGRFRKSRTANVEVHGGASLEEIVVPVITLTLRQHSKTKIEILDKECIKADRHNGVTLTVYISEVEATNNVSIVLDDCRYTGKMTGESYFEFELKNIKRPKKEPYKAEVFDADNLIGNKEFSVKGKAAQINAEFDFGDVD